MRSESLLLLEGSALLLIDSSCLCSVCGDRGGLLRGDFAAASRVLAIRALNASRQASVPLTAMPRCLPMSSCALIACSTLLPSICTVPTSSLPPTLTPSTLSRFVPVEPLHAHILATPAFTALRSTRKPKTIQPLCPGGASARPHPSYPRLHRPSLDAQHTPRLTQPSLVLISKHGPPHPRRAGACCVRPRHHLGSLALLPHALGSSFEYCKREALWRRPS